jgi:3-oxoadipate enol-lactonase
MPFANVAGTRIHYRIDGEDNAPPLLLSNSLGTLFEMWEPQVPTFSSRFRVIRYDTRGHGTSEATPGPYSIEQLGRDAVGLLDALSIPHAHFLGLSMGGATGIWLGINAPDRIDRLILANTAAKIGTTDMWNARIDAVRAGGMASIAPAVMARFFGPALTERPTPLVTQMRATFDRLSPEGYVACCIAVRDMDLRYSLGRIHRPTLVIAGSDDLSTPPDDGRYLADNIPKARYAELDAPHLSNVQAASSFTQTVVQFLTHRME